MSESPQPAPELILAQPAQARHEPPAAACAPIPRLLDPSVLKVWGLANTIATIIFLFLTLIVAALALFTQSLAASLVSAVIGLIFVTLCWTGISYNPRYYDSWRYTLRERDLDIQFGVWWRTRRCIPRSRIQHVDIRQGPIARSFGIVEVSLFTAGTIAAVVTLPGVAPAEAERLRSELLAAEGEDDDAAQAPSPGHDAH